MQTCGLIRNAVRHLRHLVRCRQAVLLFEARQVTASNGAQRLLACVAWRTLQRLRVSHTASATDAAPPARAQNLLASLARLSAVSALRAVVHAVLRSACLRRPCGHRAGPGGLRVVAVGAVGPAADGIRCGGGGGAAARAGQLGHPLYAAVGWHGIGAGGGRGGGGIHGVAVVVRLATGNRARRPAAHLAAGLGALP